MLTMGKLLHKVLGTVFIVFWGEIGSKGLTRVSTHYFILSFFLLLAFILIYRIRRIRGKKDYLMFFFILFLISFLGAWLKSSFLYFGSFLFFFGGSPGNGAERGLYLPSASSGPLGPEDDSFAVDVLMESWPTSVESGDSSATVNQPESRRVPPATHVAPRGDEAGPSNQPEPRRVPPAAHVAPRGDEAGPSNQPPQGQGVPYQYHPEELIGGDSVSSIQRRLLASNPLPSAEEINFARIQAEDLFEVKVQIIRQMEGLDPTGDWMRQGARALDSPNSATGESSLERLYSLSDDLSRNGKRSKAFFSLSEKVALRKGDLDEGSSA
ncbi:uncharacterized protein LOC143616571 [Bidens hawaiensis]|uniref:uncharacterized protein LOC143616571 n=1 Tax=Bidens hawaiensis TaxID=980011 RepID=UPI00404954BC